MFVSCERYVLCQPEASATSRSLVQGSPTERERERERERECVCVRARVIVCDQMRYD